MDINTDTLIQAIIVGVVSGLVIYYVTAPKQNCLASMPASGSKPRATDSLLLGATQVTGGTPSDTCCLCCKSCRHLSSPYCGEIPLASDYLCCAPSHGPATSKWNVGFSLQLSKPCLARVGTFDRMSSSTSYGVGGPNSTPPLPQINRKVSCNPQVPVQVCCTEIV
jgi:hypothetical protein